VVNLTKYPNPGRIFSYNRNQWLIDNILRAKVPIHIFTSTRDSQIGQLLISLENIRIKKIREGEDIKSILSDSNRENFIPVLQLYNQFESFFKNNDLEIKKFFEEFINLETGKNFKNSLSEFSKWYLSISDEDLKHYFTLCYDLIHKFLFPKLIGELKCKDIEELLNKHVSEENNVLELLNRLVDVDLLNALSSDELQTHPENSDFRTYKNSEGEVINLSYNEIISNTTTLMTLFLEFIRRNESKTTELDLTYLPSLIILDMVMLAPRVDKSNIPAIKYHFNLLKDILPDTPKHFWDILTTSYQISSHILETNSRLLQKLYTNLEKTHKVAIKNFWKDIALTMNTPEKLENLEILLPVIWSHYRIFQSIAQNLSYKYPEKNEYKRSIDVLFRLEHIFWTNGKMYLENENINSSIQFWCSYSSIANKRVRSTKDNQQLFTELNNLLKRFKILTNKTQRKKIDVNIIDQHSILQRILSYGLDSDDSTLRKDLLNYADLFKKLIDEIANEEEYKTYFSVKDEKKAIKAIYSLIDLRYPPTTKMKTMKN